MGISPPNFIVGIGGSAGGLYAYMSFLDALPANTGMAFVIISQMLPAANVALAEVLSNHTKMKVDVASNAMPILANHVYVNPPNAELRVGSYAFEVDSSATTSDKQIDTFLISLADDMKERAVGIIFSGYDGGGTEGCKQIKAKGGKTFAQDASARVGSMPHSAQASGCVDFVLPPEKMPAQLQKSRIRI